MAGIEFCSQVMGSRPKTPIIELAKVEACSPKAYLKNIPATITEVNAGMKIDDLKKFVNFVLSLSKNTARIIGKGTKTKIVQKV